MRVGVSGRPRVQPGAGRPVGDDLLRIARHRVIFGIGAEHRAGAAPARAERGRHPARALLDREPLGPQKLAIGFRRFVFAPGGFGVAPDAQVKFGETPRVLVDPLKRVALLAGHRRHPCLLVRPPRVDYAELRQSLTMKLIILCDKPGFTASSFCKTCVSATSEPASWRPCPIARARSIRARA